MKSASSSSRKRPVVLLLVVAAWTVSWALILYQNHYFQGQYRSLHLMEIMVATEPPPPPLDEDDDTTEPWSGSITNHHHDNDSDGGGGLAACLLVMDDNHFLVEWLAYHYFVGPLRSLVVAVDPRSGTSPASILDRYNTNNDSHLHIIQWYDADYLDVQSVEYATAVQSVVAQFGPPRRLTPDLVRHRVRQRLFYDACLRHHQDQGASYTLLTDTDEFLLVNYETVRASRTYTPRPISEPASVWHALQQERTLYPHDDSTQSPCLQIPRIRFGATETTDPLDWQPAPLPDGDGGGVPTGPEVLTINVSHLATVRWRTHARDNQGHVNKLSKAMVDVSRLDAHFAPVTSIHRPVKQYCPTTKLHLPPHQQVRVLYDQEHTRRHEYRTRADGVIHACCLYLANFGPCQNRF
jgi:hypothetical protein